MKSFFFIFLSTISAFANFDVSKHVELIWIVDHSSANERAIQLLKNNIHVFYNDLKKAGFSYSGVMLSSDLEKFDGSPIRQVGGPNLLSVGPDEVLDFKLRTSIAFSDLFCNNCYSSPTWALGRFLEKIKTMKDIYHNGFYSPGVPVEVLFVTSQTDHYKIFAKKSPLKNYAPVDYAKGFIDIGLQENKRIRIHGLTPECPHLQETSGDPMSVGPQETYRVLAEKTGGELISTDCDFDPIDVLHRYAKKVIQERL